jgi:hypothetical protein
MIREVKFKPLLASISDRDVVPSRRRTVAERAYIGRRVIVAGGGQVI